MFIPLYPPVVQPVFTPNFKISPPHPILDLKIGSGKEYDLATDTEMGRAHTQQVRKAQELYEQKTAERKAQLATAKEKASLASRHLKEVSSKRDLFITLLTISVIGFIGVMLAVAATNLPPLLFIAIPFFIAAASTSYYTHTYDRRYLLLKKEIEAPNLIEMPTLKLPQYDYSKDLEFVESRKAAQQMLVNASLEQLANAPWTREQMVRYALLDRVTPMKKEQRPQFYAKCLELLDAFSKISHKRDEYLTKVCNQFEQKKQAIKDKANSQYSEILNAEWTQRQMERASWRYVGLVHPFPSPSFAYRSPYGETSKHMVVVNEHEHQQANESWYHASLSLIHQKFDEAKRQLEQQFAAAKQKAAAE